MKKTIFLITWFSFTFLILINLYIFVSSIKIGSEVNSWENKISKLKKENLELENKVVVLNSYSNISSAAASLNFTQRSNAFYLNAQPPYAFSR